MIELESNLKKYKSASGTEYNIISKSIEKKEMIANLSNYKKMFFVIMVIVFLFSGMNCLIITLFSVKERIREIGIRKAYGATTADILLQMLGEAVILSFFSSIIGVLISFLISLSTIDFLESAFSATMIIKAKGSIMVFTVLMVMLQSVIFSIIPCIYAGKTKVVDALRFD